MNDLDTGTEEESLETLTIPEELSPENEITNVELNLATLIAVDFQNEAFLFNDGKENAYAEYSVSGHKEVASINSKPLNRHLVKLGRIVNKGNIPTKTTINTTVLYLEAIAFDGPVRELYNRVGKSNSDYYYDLSNDEWETIKINESGWEISNDNPPLFKRQGHQKSQVKPIRSGDINKFLEFVNIPEDKKLLFLVYVVSCFLPDIPHPVLIIFGPHGSGKSMTMEFIRSIIDPSFTPRLRVPKNDKEVIQNFDHHYAPFFDNLSSMSGDLSDMICRAVTGESSEQRSLYSNDEAIIRSYRRCIALNGINVSAEREDLLDRAILMHLEPFKEGKRSDENSLKSEFEKAVPSILGGILDTLVKAINYYLLIEIKNLPRMADFAKWGCAIAEALGYHKEEFLKIYESDGNERILETLNSNPIAIAILELMKNNNIWTGTATELLKKLNLIVQMECIEIESGQWAKDPPRLVKIINRLQPILEHQGITYHNPKSSRKITLKNKKSTVFTALPLKVEENESLFTYENVNQDNTTEDNINSLQNSNNGTNGKNVGINHGSDSENDLDDLNGEEI